MPLNTNEDNMIMKKRISYFLSIIFSLVILSSCLGQVKNEAESLYLVMSAGKDVRTQYAYDPRGEYGVDSVILNLLWKVNFDKLEVVDTLNFNHQLNNETYHFRHFDEYKWFFIKEKEYYTLKDYEQSEHSGKKLSRANVYFSVLDYGDDDLVLRKVDAKLFEPFVKNTNHGKSYIVNEELHYNFSSDSDRTYYGNRVIDKRFSNPHKVSEETYINNFYSKVESGFYSRGKHGYPFGKDGKLKFSWSRVNFKEWSDALFQVPSSEGDGLRYSNFQVTYSTPSSNYLIGQKYDFEGKADSSNLHYILTKTTEIWDSFYLPKYCRGFNVYGDELLYGSGINEACNGQDDDCFIDSIVQFKIMYPDKYSEKYGYHPFIPRMQGSIWMYHIPRKKYVEYSADDRDIEFLQIIDDRIYYRVYDEIRRMRLDMSGSYFDEDTMEVLAKDKDVIPHVHHIFYGPKVDQLKVEWVTPNPNEEKQNSEKKRNKKDKE